MQSYCAPMLSGQTGCQNPTKGTERLLESLDRSLCAQEWAQHQGEQSGISWKGSWWWAVQGEGQGNDGEGSGDGGEDPRDDGEGQEMVGRDKEMMGRSQEMMGRDRR